MRPPRRSAGPSPRARRGARRSCAAPAHAGAWPREPGAAFLSARTDLERSRDGGDLSGEIYGEYGLTKRVTLIGQLSNSDEAWTQSRASTSVNVALGALDATNRFAVSLGVSARRA